jgi:hypothetical protein
MTRDAHFLDARRDPAVSTATRHLIQTLQDAEWSADTISRLLTEVRTEARSSNSANTTNSSSNTNNNNSGSSRTDRHTEAAASATAASMASSGLPHRQPPRSMAQPDTSYWTSREQVCAC